MQAKCCNKAVVQYSFSSGSCAVGAQHACTLQGCFLCEEYDAQVEIETLLVTIVTTSAHWMARVSKLVPTKILLH